MIVENMLKDLILVEYKSLREFAKVIDIPYTTVDGIFKRGVNNANVKNIIKICKILDIEIEPLAEGKIIRKNRLDLDNNINIREKQLLATYSKLNEPGKNKVFDYTMDLCGNIRYKKTE